MKKGKFEAPPLKLYTMIVETKRIRLKTIELDFVKNNSRLVQLMCPLAVPWISRHIVVMQSRRKNCIKDVFLQVFKSTGIVQTPWQALHNVI